jgi:hypothetical protein
MKSDVTVLCFLNGCLFAYYCISLGTESAVLTWTKINVRQDTITVLYYCLFYF